MSNEPRTLLGLLAQRQGRWVSSPSDPSSPPAPPPPPPPDPEPLTRVRADDQAHRFRPVPAPPPPPPPPSEPLTKVRNDALSLQICPPEPRQPVARVETPGDDPCRSPLWLQSLPGSPSPSGSSKPATGVLVHGVQPAPVLQPRESPPPPPPPATPKTAVRADDGEQQPRPSQNPRPVRPSRGTPRTFVRSE